MSYERRYMIVHVAVARSRGHVAQSMGSQLLREGCAIAEAGKSLQTAAGRLHAEFGMSARANLKVCGLLLEWQQYAAPCKKRAVPMRGPCLAFVMVAVPTSRPIRNHL